MAKSIFSTVGTMTTITTPMINLSVQSTEEANKLKAKIAEEKKEAKAAVDAALIERVKAGLDDLPETPYNRNDDREVINDGVVVTQEEVLPYLRDWLKNHDGAGGNTFALVMKRNLIRVHSRCNQPCYGEMRKYVPSHGAACTTPEYTYRPGDLHRPFPLGEPIAVALKLRMNFTKPGELSEVAKFMLSDNSPWVAGFGSEKDVEVVWGKDGLCGLIFKNTDVDPTVLVHFFRAFKNFAGGNGKFISLIKEGLTASEAMVVLMFHGYHSYSQNDSKNYWNNNPKVNPWNAMKSIFPPELSKGTLRNRFDYNRAQIERTFADDNGINFVAELTERGAFPNGQGTAKSLAKAAKILLRD